MAQTESAFFPLKDFWAAVVKVSTTGRVPPAEPQAILGFLTLMFGKLTEHRLQVGTEFPAVFDCRDCCNNRGRRNDAACQTHAGAVRGLLESITSAPLAADYDPHADGSCTLTVTRARTSGGRSLMPEARLRQGTVVLPDVAGALVQDATRSVSVRAPPVAAAVLSALGDGAQVGQLARRLGLSEQVVVTVLAEAWLQGWIECRFAPEETPA